jgi:hypothetical protein
MWFQLKSYFKFLWSSSNQHGVHSPFVYSLVTKCFYDTKNKAAYEKIADYRKKIFQNQELIEVTDFGAGSRVFNRINVKFQQSLKMREFPGKEANYYSASLTI